MRLADQLKPVRRNLCDRDAAPDPLESMPAARRKRGSRRPENAPPLPGQVRIEWGELGFDRWLAHLSVTGQTFAARYWREQSYVLANSPFPPVIPNRGEFARQEPPMTIANRTRRTTATQAAPSAIMPTITPLPLALGLTHERRRRAQVFLGRAAVVEQGLERRPLRAALSGSSACSAHKPDAAQLNLAAELHALLAFISDPLAAHIVRARLQILPGARRPQLSFKRIAADLGISARHAKRVHAKALDQIACESFIRAGVPL